MYIEDCYDCTKEYQEDSPKVSISILTYNRKDLLRDLLYSLSKIEYKPLEIIVVDNHSMDGTDEMLSKDFSFIHHIRTDENIGVGARNLGMKSAGGEIIITVDDDVAGIGDKEIVDLVEYFRKKKDLGALNFKVLEHTTGEICNWVHHRNARDFSSTDFLTYEITEGAVAFRKKILEEVGYYPETFFLSHEGLDLAFRILNHGYSVMYSPLVAVRHMHSDLGRKSWLRYYYDTRNQFFVAARNLPVSYTLIYLARGISSMGVYSLRDGFFRYWVKGVFDGLRGLRQAMSQRSVLNKNTMKMLKAIDNYRPDLRCIIQERLFKKSVRL